jgi:hypothetical protein
MRHAARGSLNRYLGLLPDTRASPDPLLLLPVAGLGLVVIFLVAYRASITALFALTLLAVAPLLLLVAALGLIILAVGSRLPGIGPRLAPLISGLTTSIGDAGAWTSRPLRAAAMRDVVRAEVSRAGNEADIVVVVAHSQGAAVALEVVLGEEIGTGPKIDILVTVGAGISLLKSPGFALVRPADFQPVRAWSNRPSPRWVNVWAPWDLVSSGPIADTPEEQRLRWLESYDTGEKQRRARAQHERTLADERERRYRLVHPEEPSDVGLALVRAGMDGPLIDAAYDALGLPDESQQPPRPPIADANTPTRALAPGPEEWPVDNRGSVLRDHTTYTSNIVQVMRPLADLVLAMPEDTDRAAASHTDRTGSRRLISQTVHQLSFFRALALVVAVVVSPRLADAVDVPRLFEWAPVREWLSQGGVRPLLGQVLTRPLGEYLELAAVALALFVALAVLGNVTWQWLYTDLSWHARDTAFGRRAVPFQTAYLALCLTMTLVMMNDVPDTGEELVSAAFLAAVVYSTPWMSVLPAWVPSRKAAVSRVI